MALDPSSISAIRSQFPIFERLKFISTVVRREHCRNGWRPPSASICKLGMTRVLHGIFGSRNMKRPGSICELHWCRSGRGRNRGKRVRGRELTRQRALLHRSPKCCLGRIRVPNHGTHLAVASQTGRADQVYRRPGRETHSCRLRASHRSQDVDRATDPRMFSPNGFHACQPRILRRSRTTVVHWCCWTTIRTAAPVRWTLKTMDSRLLR